MIKIIKLSLILLLLNCNIVYGSIEFDGDNDYVDSNDATDLTTTMSCIAWIYPHSFGENALGRIFDKRDSVDTNQCLLFWIAGSTGTDNLQFEVDTSEGAGQWITDEDTIVGLLNTLIQVAFTYDASDWDNDPLIYINNVSVNITENSTPTGTIKTNDANYIIGNRANDTARSFDGEIVKITLWNVVLTPEEISLDYNAKIRGTSIQIQPSGIVWDFPFDDGTAGATTPTSAREGTGGTAGTLTNGPVWRAEKVLSYPPGVLGGL